MRQILKGKEPKVLLQYRKTPGATYNGFQSVERMRALRKALVSEQGGICCYCMQRIRPTEDAMKVEHWHSQKRYPTEQLNYRNMLAACMGNKGEPKDEQHCDTSKGNKTLSRNPANPDHRIEHFIRYLGDGRIESSDQELSNQLGKGVSKKGMLHRGVLNLNRPLFVLNRQSVLDMFHKSLPHDGTLKRPNSIGCKRIGATVLPELNCNLTAELLFTGLRNALPEHEL
jgi:uncharacterized protein (TIGR02646 family)